MISLEMLSMNLMDLLTRPIPIYAMLGIMATLMIMERTVFKKAIKQQEIETKLWQEVATDGNEGMIPTEKGCRG